MWNGGTKNSRLAIVGETNWIVLPTTSSSIMKHSE